jgi:hypothetical protein
MRREMCVCLYVCIGATGPTSRLKSGQAVLGSKDWSFGSSLDLIQLRVRRVAELNVKFILGYNFHAGGRETRGRQRFMEGGGLGKRASVGLPRLLSCDICIRAHTTLHGADVAFVAQLVVVPVEYTIVNAVALQRVTY